MRYEIENDFVFDAELESLNKGTVKTSLTAKHCAVLAVLLAEQGKTVSREDILNRVWPQSSMGPQSVDTAIWQARAALGDDKNNPRYIKTYPGRGYRFIGSASVVPMGALSASSWSNEACASRFKALKERVNTNQLFSSNLQIRRSPTTQLPNLVRTEGPQSSSRYERAAKKISNELREAKQPDDPCAVLVRDPDWSDEPLSVSYVMQHYSDVQASKRFKLNPKMLSAAGVLYSAEEQCVLVHRRSARSRDHVDTLHTFGGMFMPPDVSGRGDINGPKECLEREVHEETGIGISVQRDTPVVLIDGRTITLCVIRLFRGEYGT